MNKIINALGRMVILAILLNGCASNKPIGKEMDRNIEHFVGIDIESGRLVIAYYENGWKRKLGERSHP